MVRVFPPNGVIVYTLSCILQLRYCCIYAAESIDHPTISHEEDALEPSTNMCIPNRHSMSHIGRAIDRNHGHEMNWPQEQNTSEIMPSATRFTSDDRTTENTEQRTVISWRMCRRHECSRRDLNPCRSLERAS